jgi:ribonuclease E
MTDPNARQQWDDLLADLGFEPTTTPPTAPTPSAPTAPQVDADGAGETTEDSATPATEPEGEASTARRKKTRTKTTKSKSGKTTARSRSEAETEEAPAKPRRRKKVSEVLAEGEAEPTTEGAVVASPEIDGASLPEATPIAEVQPIPIEVPPVNVGEGVIEIVEITETVEITTFDLATREKQTARDEGSSRSLTDPSEDTDKSDSDKKRRRRRRRGKARGREETIAPRTIEAAKGRPVAREEDEEADEEVVGETGGGLVPAVDEEDDVEFIDLSDLQVPSWPELVASLYRPPDR